MVGMVTDLVRSTSELVAENAFLRQQLIILRRQVKRPACTKADRFLLVLLARMVRTWKQALFIVQPETRLAVASPRIQALLEIHVPSSFIQTESTSRDSSVIQEMAMQNRLWGAERIRGELLKLVLLVSKRTIQKYMRQVRTT